MTKSFALLVNTVPFCQSFDFFYRQNKLFQTEVVSYMFFFLYWKIDTEEQKNDRPV